MATMTKMRDNAHIFIIAFIVIFVAFWVVSDADIGSIMQGSQDEVGNIDGRAISYQEYNNYVQRIAESRQQQDPTFELTDATSASVREQAWNEYITQAVIERAVEELGVVVTDQEITDWVRSDSPPELLAQQFRDSTGQFNRDAYEQFLANPGAENREALVAIEEMMRSEMVRSKLTSLLASTVFVTEEDLRDKWIEDNVRMTAQYVFFNPRVVAATDTTEPTQEEYEAYYEKNKEQFRREESRKLLYVVFDDVPSQEDSAVVLKELRMLREEAEAGTDFVDLILETSEEPYDSTRWQTLQEFAPEAVEKLATASVGDIIGPVPTIEGGFAVYKVMNARKGEETLVEASHILLRTDSGESEEQQKAKAERILQEAKSGKDFGMLAAMHSEEPGAAERQGYLSWFGKGRMVPEFEEAAMAADPGEIVGPVKTQFGYHIIKVTNKSDRELQVGAIQMAVNASSSTQDRLFERAEEFAYLANETSFEQEAETSQLAIQETPEFSRQGGSFIPGVGISLSLMNFAYDAGVGDISDVVRGTNGYVVAKLTEEIPEGYRPLNDELKAQIRPTVIFQRQLDRTKEKVAKLGGGSIEAYANNQWGATVQTTQPFTLASGPPSIGRDDAFVGKVMGLKEGQVSKPFKSQRGVYVVKMLNKGQFDEAAFSVKREELRSQMLQQMQNEFIQNWLEEKKEDLTIIDNRHRFFR
ncbi:MAG: hypothetical protein CL946_13625 [Ectothiorhodospiraceae bacterium]|nr:hypothetical protein [Ectothiorhodospiraceae bacterium]